MGFKDPSFSVAEEGFLEEGRNNTKSQKVCYISLVMGRWGVLNVVN
ncbi:MAG: hypothetical protein F6K18_07250 [Okeania sp. SIO2C2]|nr:MULTISPECIES: hypothetical protein [unclassified Okeania]NEP04244.1 hypothetical protein [Okeania sp. SIO4D6]NEP86643.1 hypothetical protein [Okeania sp. SIO2C2]NEP91502.1 hypothetical protein [Okeania sp. SIO2F5]NEQ89378.1 hypothetical protein [Okeania sp. SIO2G4]